MSDKADAVLYVAALAVDILAVVVLIPAVLGPLTPLVYFAGIMAFIAWAVVEA